MIKINLIKIFATRGLSSVGLLLLTYFINHVYGLDYLGDFSVVFSVFGICLILSRVGTENLIIKKGSYIFFIKDKKNMKAIIGKTSLIVSFFSILISCICFGVILFFPFIEELINISYAKIFLIYLLPFSLSGILSALAKATKKSWCYPFYELGFSAFVASIFLMVLIIVDRKIDFIYFLHMYALINLLIMIIGCFYNFYIVSDLNDDINEVHSESKLPVGSILVFFVINLFAYISTNGIPFVMSYFFDNVSVGEFVTAFRLSITINLVISIINANFISDFAVEFKKGDMAGLKKTVNLSSFYLNILCMPILIFMFLLSGHLISFFGVDDVSGDVKHVLCILLIGQFFNVITGSATPLMNMTGLHVYNLIITIISTVICLFLIYFLSPKYHLIGVAGAVSFYWAVKNLASAWCLHKFIKVNVFKLKLSNE